MNNAELKKLGSLTRENIKLEYISIFTYVKQQMKLKMVVSLDKITSAFVP